MRWFLLCLGLVGALGAQVPLHIIGVERQGLPPYDTPDRIYRLDGGQERGLRVGDRLLVKRTGELRAFGQLRVVEVRGDHAATTFEPAADTYPMKGDLAFRQELKWMPGAGRLIPDPLPIPPPPRATLEAPPREGILFFQPQRADLSPAGLKKLEAWVEEWGAEGRWAVQVPVVKAVKPTLQKARAEVLQGALRAMGIERVKLETEPRAVEGKYDPAWIRHWE
jgi:hypothetical protein